MIRSYVAAAVLATALIGVTGCDRSSETSSTPPTTPTTPGANDNTMNTTPATPADRTMNNTGTAGMGTTTTQPTTESSVPGMPSVNGTGTSDMKTQDAAAIRLIDNAKNNIQQGDVDKAKTLLNELNGMYDKLSPSVKAQVDALKTAVNSAPAKP